MRVRFFLAVALVAATAPRASAHHSFAMFDSDKTVTLSGAVTHFLWTNPHCWLDIAVLNGAGETDWQIETNSPGAMTRGGWRPDTLSPGDTVMVTIHPRKDGALGGQLVSVVFTDKSGTDKTLGAGHI